MKTETTFALESLDFIHQILDLKRPKQYKSRL